MARSDRGGRSRPRMHDRLGSIAGPSASLTPMEGVRVFTSAPYLRSRLAVAAVALTLALVLSLVQEAPAGPIEDRLHAALGSLDTRELATGVLYDRVLPFSGIERFTGGAGSAVASRSLWRQLYEELRRASADPSLRPAAETVVERARR